MLEVLYITKEELLIQYMDDHKDQVDQGFKG